MLLKKMKKGKKVHQELTKRKTGKGMGISPSKVENNNGCRWGRLGNARKTWRERGVTGGRINRA